MCSYRFSYINLVVVVLFGGVLIVAAVVLRSLYNCRWLTILS